MKPVAVPPGAGAVFGDAVAAVARYGGWLVGPGVERGLVGPHEADRVWERHLLNCAALLGPLEAALPTSRAGAGSVCDLGSGAGLPGIVVALMRPDLDVVLLEPLLRRATFLAEVVADLELSRVTVARMRAEEAVGSVSVDVVVARAVAPLERLARWSLPLLRPGGVLLALKGERAGAELAEAGPALDRLGVVERTVLPVSAGGATTQVVRLVGAADPVASQRPGRGGGRHVGQR